VVQEAVLIVRGTTGSSTSDWGKGDAKGSIFTYTDFEITEVLKDATGQVEAGKRIVIKQPGGEKDGVEMSVAATAVFQPGEDVVLTLSAPDASDDSYTVLNLTAGKYNITTENGQTMIVNSLGGGEVYDPGRSQDAKILSYNSKIPLDTMRALARGERREEAERAQFAPSSQPGPRSDGHNHSASSAGAQAPSQPMQQQTADSSPVDANGQEQEQDSSGAWLQWYFYGAILILGLLGLLYGFSRKGRK
jgi:hypothetical protein